ncbi:hypothetical protein [Acetatifactor aquisgranensis]|uniref:hypothetical protein n=1 Tax=Acetatifactor aquisgranensis TaxID=2941233 RepID=UPI00203BD3E7|nr:hypothetical protein [Acetatifactor aquisgranensis]MCI8542297.1 hypothetical protein [Lachnospiraceae bacterium]
MFRVFQEERLITICMFTCLGISIILRIFLGLLYRNMIKEADNMASTKNRLLRQCKTKFASCYELTGGVANIPVFVDKFLGRMALGPLSFDTLYHLSGQMMLLSVVCSGIGVCKSILGGRTLGDVLPFYIASFFGLYAYFSISTVVDVSGKKRVLKVNLVDYLENHLSPRIEITRQDIEMLYGESVFEEKRESRSQNRGKRRRSGRGAAARPQERRTLELMPIGNRLAAGGEELADTEAGQAVSEPVLTPPQSVGSQFQNPSMAGNSAVGDISAMTAPSAMAGSSSMADTSAMADASAMADTSAIVTEEELEALLKEFLTS